MPSPCNNLNVVPIKVSQLVRYSNIDVTDYFLTIESGSALYSRKSTFGDLINSFKNVTGSYSGSFSGSFYGKFIGNNSKVSGSLSGSYFGQIKSKNTIASGSFSGSYYGLVNSKNLKATGSFNGSIVSSNTKTTGSFYGSLVSSNTKATGSFNGTLVSSNTKASGSFSGSYYGKLFGKNAILSGSFSGSHYGKMIASKGSIVTGSFRGIDNITNFKGTGKKVSFNGTSSYAVSASYALSASYVNNGLNSGFGGLGSGVYLTGTSTLTLSNFSNSNYSINHSFATVPSLIRVTLLCVTTDQEYNPDDEISVEQLHDDTGGADDERPITSVWTSNTQVGVSFANWQGGVYTNKKTGGRVALNTASWKIKIRAWK